MTESKVKEIFQRTFERANSYGFQSLSWDQIKYYLEEDREVKNYDETLNDWIMYAVELSIITPVAGDLLVWQINNHISRRG